MLEVILTKFINYHLYVVQKYAWPNSTDGIFQHGILKQYTDEHLYWQS
jgi:hypothetical protein